MNLDEQTVRGVGEEWTVYDECALDGGEQGDLFGHYFALFPWDRLPEGAQGFDLGCGTGRWAKLVAPRVGVLHCIDASAAALGVARRNLAGLEGCHFHAASVDRMPLLDGSMDFG